MRCFSWNYPQITLIDFGKRHHFLRLLITTKLSNIHNLLTKSWNVLYQKTVFKEKRGLSKLNSWPLEFHFFTMKTINIKIGYIWHKCDAREYSRPKKTTHIARTLIALLCRNILTRGEDRRKQRKKKALCIESFTILVWLLLSFAGERR